jgi:hypothetical protein
MTLESFYTFMDNYLTLEANLENFFFPIFHVGIWMGVLIQPFLKRALLIYPRPSEVATEIANQLPTKLPRNFTVSIEELGMNDADSGVLLLMALYFLTQCSPIIFPPNVESVVMFRNFFAYHFTLKALPWM